MNKGSALRKGLSVTGSVSKYIFLTAFFILKWVLIIALIALLFGASAGYGYITALVHDDEVRSEADIYRLLQEDDQTGFVYFGDGTAIGQLRTDEDRRMVELSEIPPLLIQAFIATEDQHFMEHPGIDINGVVRAFSEMISADDNATGGSTITQQLARRVFLSYDRSHTRKAKEMFLALRLERILSKDQILTAYLNKIPFGQGSTGYNLHGVKAAAKGIFDLELQDLHLAQAAYIAGLPQQPSNFSAFNNRGVFDYRGFERAKTRQQHVLNRMRTVGFITEREYNRALDFDLLGSIAETTQRAYNTYPYLMLEAEREAAELIYLSWNPDLTVADLRNPSHADGIRETRDYMLRNGFHIHTTIDQQLYDMMREIAADPENFTPDHEEKGMEQIAAIMIDNQTGAILSMIEGRDFYSEQMNLATQMMRQPGSAMKPISAYLPAIEAGILQPASIIDDVPIILPDGGNRGYHLPENWNRIFHGRITARVALNRSYNIPAIRLFVEDVGIDAAWDFTKRLGITTIVDSDYHAQTGIIGGMYNGTTVKELTSAYSSIGSKGTYNKVYMIEKITDSDGNVFYQHIEEPTSVFSEETAYLMSDMMRTVITTPGATATSIMTDFKHFDSIPVVGKTGTTQNDADAWFIGLTPDITLGVWAGYELPRYTLSRPSGTNRAKTIWSMVMDGAVEAKPNLFPGNDFIRPDSIIEFEVSSVSGNLPSPFILEEGLVNADIFNIAHIPTVEDSQLVEMKLIQFEDNWYLPHPQTPEDMLTLRRVIVREKPIDQLIEELHELFEDTPDDLRFMVGNRPKTAEEYRPIDANLDAPGLRDPREDDDIPPSAPVRVAIYDDPEGHMVSFVRVKETNVVGYRMYRSIAGGPFEQMNQTILQNEESSFHDRFTNRTLKRAYYAVAVDVFGRESDPSPIAERQLAPPPELEEPSIPLPTDPPIPGDPNEPEDPTEPGNENGETPHGTDLSPPSSPEGLFIREQGQGIRISWNDSPSSQVVIEYYVQMRELAESDSESGWTTIGTTNRARFDFVEAPQDAWYRVAARNPQGLSPYSEPLRYSY